MVRLVSWMTYTKKKSEKIIYKLIDYEMRKITHGSTFSGIGAPEIAAEMLGWYNLFHCEINPFGRQILDYYFPNAKSYEDITKTDFSEWRGKVDVLTGGFPCQPFSCAGKRRGAEDDRYLWTYMLKCISQVRPTWCVCENVVGITSMVFPSKDVKVGDDANLFGTSDYMERREVYVINEICNELEHEGYSVQPLIIPACSVGAPHRIDRVFFIAHNDSEDSMHSRLMGGEHDEQRDKRNVWDACSRSAERICREAWSKLRVDKKFNKTETCTEEQLSTYSECFGRNEKRDESGKPTCSQQTECGEQQLCGTDGSFVERLLPENRWRAFPSVSPVCRRDDGFPIPMDNLTIPFEEWKRESIKAYGNAIVVQVMYRRFEAINEIEQN